MKNQKQNIGIIKTSAVFIAMIVITLCSFWLYSKELIHIVEDDYTKRLTEIAQNNKFNIESTLYQKKVFLDYLSDFLAKNADGDINVIEQQLKKIVKADTFVSMGIIDENKNIYLSDENDRSILTIKKLNKCFEKGMQGEATISRVVDEYNKDICKLVIGVPINKNKEIKGVLFGVYDIAYMRNLITLNMFDGVGYVVIIDENGNKVLASEKLEGLEDEKSEHNILESISLLINSNQKDSIKAQLMEDIKNHKEGLVEIQLNKPMYVYYQSLGMVNLSMLTVIPKSIIVDKYQLVMNYTYMLFSFLIIIIIIISIVFFRNQKNKNKYLQKILFEDEITEGYSYRRFEAEVRDFLKKDNKSKVFMALDIDNFKLINEVFDYTKGNKVLQEISLSIQKLFKDRVLFTRKYADKFFIILKFENYTSLLKDVENLINDIKHIEIQNGKSYKVIPSIGIYEIKDFDEDLIDMENCAIMATNLIKNKYDVEYNFYYKNIKEKFIKDKELIDNIYVAIKNNEFYPYYQPKYSVNNKYLIGAEALIRWIRPDGTFVSPAEFIPVAEQYGAIMDIDIYMFKAVCKQQGIWKRQGIKIVPVSVNVSRKTLYRSNFIQDYLDIIKENGTEAKDIHLEITEGSLVTASEVAENIVDKMKEAGFKVLIDDFGTGYSSICLIKELKADKMKIDKSFIDDMSETGKLFIRHVVEIAKTANMETVAEGVETEEQYRFLKDINCDAIQGYYFAKPMPAKEYEHFLRNKQMEK